MTTQQQTIGTQIRRRFTIDSSPLTWVVGNDMVNERGEAIEFYYHRFLAPIMIDLTPTQVILKAAQVGGTVIKILKTMWAVQKVPLTAIYTLPTRSIVSDFIDPKVTPLIENNQVIKQSLGATNTKNIKKFGNHFLFFRGSFEEREAIAFTADLLVNDEDDRSKQNILRIYQTRMDHSKYRWLWKFSNPSIPGVGVDVAWQISDQKEWVVWCRNKHPQLLTWPGSIDPDRRVYQCKKCHVEITDVNRISGRWLAMKASNKDVSGYHISQLMCPWISAEKILYDHETADPQTFHNFTLGLPYLSAETQITLQDILNACDHEAHARSNNTAMGVDVGHVKHYTLGNEYGIYRFGTFKEWNDLERILLVENVRACVIDAHPDLTKPRELARKYPGRVYVAWYVGEQRSMKDNQVPPQERTVFKLDRTKVFDQMLADIRAGNQIFNFTTEDMRQYAPHFTCMFKVIEKTPTGNVRMYWDTQENKPDHWAHSAVYFRAALAHVNSYTGIIIKPKPKPADISPTVALDGTIPAVSIQRAIRHAVRGSKSWRTM